MRRPLLLCLVACLAVGFVACVSDAVGTDGGTTDMKDTGAADSGGASDSPGSDSGNCMGGLSDCNGTCVNLNMSDAHCGKCGHSCEGGQCTAGVCQPLTICNSVNTPTTIDNIINPAVVVAAAKGSLVRCQKAGGAPATKLWSGTTVGSRPNTDLGFLTYNGELRAYFLGNSLFPDGGPNGQANIYYANVVNPTVAPNYVASDASLVGLALDPTQSSILVHRQYEVLACTSSNNTLVPVGGAYGGQAVAQGQGNPGLWVWADESGSRIGRCNRSNPPVACNPQTSTLTTNANDVRFLQVVGSTVYWAHTPNAGKHRILSCAVAGCNNQPNVITANELKIGGLAVDLNNAYWTDPVNGQVRSCSLANCTPNVLAGSEASPTGITVDLNAIYWTNSVASGSIRKLAKP